MEKDSVYVGMDVHAETIAVAVAEDRSTVRSVGTIPNRPEAVRRLIGRLGPRKSLRVCYEAGPTGYVLYWQLTQMGIHCDVIAPSLVPMKASDRIKTDRRDAERLARSYRSGDLTTVWVPDSEHEALRDIVRAREAAKEDELRAKHRLSKYLLRYGERPAEGVRPWTAAWWQWARALRLPQANQNVVLYDHILEVDQQAHRIARLDAAIETAIAAAPAHLRTIVDALQALRGVAKLTAITPCDRVRIVQAFRERVAGDELHRARSIGALQRRKESARWHNQDGEFSLASGAHRGSLALSSPSSAWKATEGTAERNPSTARGDGVEGAGATLPTLLGAIGEVEAERQDRNGSRTRARRLHLGNR
jgi:transposase